MSEDYKAYLRHILEECLFIVSAMKGVNSLKELTNDEEKKRAIVRSLEIIGEATKKISADVKYKWKEVEWKAIAGMRDKLIHDYTEVDYEIVWDTVTRKIPQLKIQVEKILADQ